MRPFTVLRRKFWIPFLLACGVVAITELVIDHMVETEELPSVIQTIFNLSGVYQAIVTAPRAPTPRFTAVVEVDATQDPRIPDLTDIPHQRAVMARLLCRIASASPSVIVIDKFYSAKSYGDADKELRQAVQSILRRNISVVVGRVISDEESQHREVRPLLPAFDFAAGDQGPQAAARLPDEGIINLDRDTRRLPLRWDVLADGDSTSRKSLALVAATAFDFQLMAHHERLQSFIDKKDHPYISFLRESDFSSVRLNTKELLPTAEQTTECSSEQPTVAMVRRLRGKIVIIGERYSGIDQHPTPVGHMLGLYAQANYIEALLDDRYYTPMPILDYVFGFIFLVCLELFLIVYEEHGISGFGAAMGVVGLFASSLVVLYLITVHLKWYVNPAMLGGIAIAIKLVNQVFGAAEKEARSELETPKGV